MMTDKERSELMLKMVTSIWDDDTEFLVILYVSVETVLYNRDDCPEGILPNDDN